MYTARLLFDGLLAGAVIEAAGAKDNFENCLDGGIKIAITEAN